MGISGHCCHERVNERRQSNSTDRQSVESRHDLARRDLPNRQQRALFGLDRPRCDILVGL